MSDQAAYDVEHPPAPQGARRGGPVDAHVGVGARQPGGVPRAARGVDRDTPPGAASLAVAAQGSARSSSAKPVARPTTSSRQGGSAPSAWWSAPRWCARPAVAQTVVDDAEASARQLRHEAEDYVDQKLAAFEVVLERTLQAVGEASACRSSSRPIRGPGPTSPSPSWRSCRARSRSRRSWKRRSSTRTPVRRISPRLADSGNRGALVSCLSFDVPVGRRRAQLLLRPRHNDGRQSGAAHRRRRPADPPGFPPRRAPRGAAGFAGRVSGSRPDDQPVVLDLVLERVSDGVVVRGTVRAVWRGTCGVCLTDLEHTLTPAVGELFDPSPSRATRAEGHEIDLEQLVRDVVLLELPLAPTCETTGRSPCEPMSSPRRIRRRPTRELVGVVRTRPELRDGKATDGCTQGKTPRADPQSPRSRTGVRRRRPARSARTAVP